MGTKKKESESKNRVKVNKLKLHKETIKELTTGEARKVRGGAGSIKAACGEDTWANCSADTCEKTCGPSMLQCSNPCPKPIRG